jgi:hypothetical protein
MDPETEHADANMYKDDGDGDGDGGDMKAKVYKTVWSPEVRPRSPRKPEVLPARVRRLELFRFGRGSALGRAIAPWIAPRIAAHRSHESIVRT